MLTRMRSFPDLVALVLDSDADYPGSMSNHPINFREHFPGRGPTFDAPALRVLHLTCIFAQLPTSKQLRHIRLSSRVIVDDEDDDPTFFLRYQWPKKLLFSLLYRQNHLTSLEIVDAVYEDEGNATLGTVDLPSLEKLIVCSASSNGAAWVLNTIECSPEAAICVRVGHGAQKAIDLQQLFSSLGTFVHLLVCMLHVNISQRSMLRTVDSKRS